MSGLQCARSVLEHHIGYMSVSPQQFAAVNVQPTAHSTIAKVSVILPTYNEVGNIVALCDALHRVITHAHEIIVVDDNSPDGTSPAVQTAIDAGRDWLRLEIRLKDRGLRKSIWRGVELATGDIIIWMDCDFSMPPKVVGKLLEKIDEGYDLAVGSRFISGGSHKCGVRMGSTRESWVAIALSRCLNVALRMLLSRRFFDWTSGFIAVRASIVRRIGLRGDYGEYFMDFMERAILLHYSFVEVPYVCVPRKSGETKTAPNFCSLCKRGSKYLVTMVKLQGVRLKKMLGMRIT